MCTVSKNLKLCSCASKAELKKAPHTWTLISYNEDLIEQNKNHRIGMMYPPDHFFDITKGTHRMNKAKITRQLNKGTAFDKQMHFKEQDLLSLSFTCAPYEDKLVYVFLYRNGHWSSADADEYTQYLYENDNKRQTTGVAENGII